MHTLKELAINYVLYYDTPGILLKFSCSLLSTVHNIKKVPNILFPVLGSTLCCAAQCIVCVNLLAIILGEK